MLPVSGRFARPERRGSDSGQVPGGGEAALDRDRPGEWSRGGRVERKRGGGGAALAERGG